MLFHFDIWNLDEKYNLVSANMPSIGLLICEIAFEMLNILGKQSVVVNGARNCFVRVRCTRMFVQL